MKKIIFVLFVVFGLMSCENIALSTNDDTILVPEFNIEDFQTRVEGYPQITWNFTPPMIEITRMSATTAPSDMSFYDYGTISETSIDSAYSDWSLASFPNQYIGDYNLEYPVDINTLNFTVTDGTDSADFYIYLDNNYEDGFLFYMFGVDGVTIPDFFYGHTFEITIMWDAKDGTTYEHTYTFILDSSFITINEIIDTLHHENEVNDDIYNTDQTTFPTIKYDADNKNINDMYGWYECYNVGIKGIQFIDTDSVEYYTWTNPSL